MSIVITEGAASANPYLNKIKLVHGDITEQKVGAIISLLPHSLEYTGAINQAILERAGPALDEFVLEHIYKPRPGDVYAVPGFDLPASNVIFAFRPPWKNDFDREDKHLVTCVRKAMVLAKCMLLKRIAFPPLAADPRQGYGPQRSARLVIQGILDRIDSQYDEILIVCKDQATYDAYYKKLISLGWTGV